MQEFYWKMVDHNLKNVSEEESIDIRAILEKVWGKKWLIFCSVAFSLVLGMFYFYSAVPLYKVTTSILLNGKDEFGVSELFDISYQQNEDVENAISILQSYSLVKKTIEHLDFDVTYKSKIGYKEREIYPFKGFKLLLDPNLPQIINSPINIEVIDDDSLRLFTEGLQIAFSENSKQFFDIEPDFYIDTIIAWNRLFRCKYLSIIPKRLERLQERSLYQVIINSQTSLIEQWQGFDVQQNEGTVLSLSFIHHSPAKASAFFNQHCQQFLNKTVRKKDLKVEQTIKFIDEQLLSFRDSLESTEQVLEDFKTQTSVVDLSVLSENFFNELSALKKQEASLSIRSKYYEFLLNNLNDESALNQLVSPAAMDINDPLLVELISSLLSLVQKKEQLGFFVKKETAMNAALVLEIEQVKQSVKENVVQTQEKTLFQMKEIGKQIDSLESKLGMMPKNERKMLQIKRKFTLNEELYTFLLEKRADCQILKAANVPDDEVLDIARPETSKIISPNRTKILAISGFLGVAVPVLLILVIFYLKNTITDRHELESMTDKPFLGNIMLGESGGVVFNHNNSPVAESFRSLRTNIQFSVAESEKKVFLLTSCLAGEGKSFVASNISACLAASGKKVLLVGADLRKPSLHRYFNMNSSLPGLTNYLIGRSSFDEVVHENILNSVSVVFAGVIPPNPNELLASDKMDDFFEIAQNNYDYIIIDTPPVGLVSDAILLHKYSSVNLLIVRSNFCKKDVLKMTLQNLEQSGFSNLYTVINAMDLKNRRNYYAYNYEEKKPLSLFQKVRYKKSV